MKQKLQFIALVFFAFSTTLSAQTNEKKAFQKFKEAREAYQNNNYLNTANLLIDTKNLLGATNVRIQPMLIKSLVQIEHWQLANSEIDIYYGLNPNQSLVEYQDIVKLDRSVDQKVKEELALYQATKTTKSVSKMELYLSKYPYGKYRDEIKASLENQKDENKWKDAESQRNTSAYSAYLRKYPEGNHAEEAQQQITAWDDAAFEKAKSEDSQSALEYYLSNYPDGNYRTQIRSMLNIRKEEDAYTRAKSGNLSDLKNYANKYPQGKYVTQVNKGISKYMFNKAETAYAEKRYSRAAGYYKDYMNTYPLGEFASKAASKQKTALRKSKQIDSGFFGATYTTEGAFGITGGRSNKDKLGMYYNLSFTPEVFSIQFVKPEIEVPTNTTIPADAKFGVVNFTLGLSYPIAYPVWLYAGGGARYGERYFENSEGENTFFLIEGEKNLNFFPEAGVRVHLGGLVLSGGAAFTKENTFLQFGIGFRIY